MTDILEVVRETTDRLVAQRDTIRIEVDFLVTFIQYSRDRPS